MIPIAGNATEKGPMLIARPVYARSIVRAVRMTKILRIICAKCVWTNPCQAMISMFGYV